ncbi:MAG TPA: hypothetical protein VFE46_08240 [Pirellulales bacterium]|jgi:ABC-type bacteriocin/lantibiotic exporter with double-glycine peptidase domain|nr:hypothetical protein [Pirellulales bacterium]
MKVTIFHLLAAIVLFGVAAYFIPVLLIVYQWVGLIAVSLLFIAAIVGIIWPPARLLAKQRRANLHESRKENSN